MLRSTGMVQRSEDPTGHVPLITLCLKWENYSEEHQNVKQSSLAQWGISLGDVL